MQVYDRNGTQLIVFTKGDPYLLDMKNTHGHSALVTGIQWHPSHSDVRVCEHLCAPAHAFWSLDWQCGVWLLVLVTVRRGVAMDLVQIIISCGNDGVVRVWDLVNAVRTFDKEIKNSQVRAVC